MSPQDDATAVRARHDERASRVQGGRPRLAETGHPRRLPGNVTAAPDPNPASYRDWQHCTHRPPRTTPRTTGKRFLFLLAGRPAPGAYFSVLNQAHAMLRHLGLSGSLLGYSGVLALVDVLPPLHRIQGLGLVRELCAQHD